MGDLAIAVAKKTGDYSVLSHADICVVALTYELDLQEKEKSEDLQVSCLSPFLLWRVYAELRSGRTGSRSRGSN